LAIIKETINQKQLELLRKSLWLWNIRETTLTTAGSTSEYYLPSDFYRPLDVRQLDSPTQLTRVSAYDFDMLVPKPTAVGNPQWYVLLLDERVKAQPTTSDKIVAYSTSDSDVSPQTGATAVTIYGVASGVDRSEVLTLSATNEVSSTGSYSKLYSISANLKPVGSLYFRELTAATELLVLFPNDISLTFKKMKVHPIPDAASTLYVKYEATRPPLINASDMLLLPDDAANVMVEMVVGDLMLKQGDQKAAAWIQLADKHIDEMKKNQDMMWDYEPLIGPQMTGYRDIGSPFTVY
jgi:hypothetical protein